MDYSKKNIVVVGLGYVGLPLAVNFANTFDVIGYDISDARINSLKNFKDSTKEISSIKLKKAKRLKFSSNIDEIKKQHIYIITVPTPVNDQNLPDLTLLKAACKLVGKVMAKNAIVIFESTVYPGVTRKICAPIIAKYSSYKCNKSFFIGYSPERINPGDKKHRLPNIKKITSGSNIESAKFIDKVYRTIIIAGTHKAESIKVAEAAKVIENTQRDLNIALINELAIIFNLMDIDTESVLKAAETKWNFLSFRPGLVGGHCIGVDPYYLTHKSESLGYSPEIILAGRRLNDGMGSFVSSQLVKLLSKKNIKINSSKILILGLSFKEDCPDIRNTKVIDIINELIEYDCDVDVFDPWVDKRVAAKEYDIDLLDDIQINYYDAIVIAVSHKQFKKMGIEVIKSFGKQKHILYDLKYLFSADQTDRRL